VDHEGGLVEAGIIEGASQNTRVYPHGKCVRRLSESPTTGRGSAGGRRSMMMTAPPAGRARILVTEGDRRYL
jgi:hypothetical protein